MDVFVRLIFGENFEIFLVIVGVKANVRGNSNTAAAVNLMVEGYYMMVMRLLPKLIGVVMHGSDGGATFFFFNLGGSSVQSCLLTS